MTKHKFSVRLTPLVFALGVSLVAGCSTVEELIGSEGQALREVGLLA